LLQRSQALLCKFLGALLDPFAPGDQARLLEVLEDRRRLLWSDVADDQVGMHGDRRCPHLLGDRRELFARRPLAGAGTGLEQLREALARLGACPLPLVLVLVVLRLVQGRPSRRGRAEAAQSAAPI
jgi:hypothetical protein